MNVWETLWSAVGWFLSAFVFIAYLMVLFSVVTDIIRDHALKGWMKALWLIFLIFVPFITALVYLIARGGGMSQRTAARIRESAQDTDDYIRSVAQPGPAQQIEKAAELLQAGDITEEEYQQLKRKVLTS